MPKQGALAVDRMTERSLWTSLLWHIEALDPMNFSHQPGQTHRLALEAFDIAFELRLRGTQLSLLHPEPQSAA